MGGYVILALALTYPLVLQFGDHVPGTTTWSMDEYGYVWNNWWFKHAVFDLGTNPFQTNYLVYPLGTSLVLYTFTLLHVLLGLPIQFAFGLIPASNVELLFAFVLNAFGMFLLADYVLRQARLADRRAFAAFVAGVVFAFASNRFVYASLGHYNVVATEWIPFYILFLIKTVRAPNRKNAMLAGLFAACALYVEITDGVLLVLFTALYLLSVWRVALRRPVLAQLARVGATAAGLFAPLLVPTLGEILTSGYVLPGWGHAEKLLVDLFGLLTPTGLQSFNPHWTQELDAVRQGVARFSDVNTVFLGYATLALAVLATVRHWQTLKVWAMSALVFTILSLGPLLHLNGQSTFDLDGLQVTFPLPFLLLHYIPLLKENRVPNRFSVLVMLSLAVLVAFAVSSTRAWVSQKFQGKHEPWALGLPLVFLVLILLEHASIPLPLTDARIPEVYTQIAREPGNFAVLTLPLGWRNSFGQLGAEDTRAQYYQSAMGKYIFPANLQRNPPFLFDYFDRIPLFHSLTEIESYRPVSDEDLMRDQAFAPLLMSFFDVRYVVIQPPIPGRPPYSDTHDAVLAYVRQVLPLGDKVYDRDGLIAYRINQPPLPDRQRINFGTSVAQFYRAEGWDRDEAIAGENANWANQKTARVLLPIRDVADYNLTIRALPFNFADAPTQTMRVLVNNQPLETFVMQADWQEYTVTIPARVLHSGINNLTLEFDYVFHPRAVLPAHFEIGDTGTVSPVDIQVTAGDAGSIQVNQREVSPLARGYNVAVIDPASGQVLKAKAFNTADDKAQSRLMTDFLAQVPNGFIVAVASQESAAANLGDRTVTALKNLGGAIDLRQTPTVAHALIGVKGAPANSAVEDTNEGNVFLAVGHVPDDRTLAAAVSAITIEKK